MARPLRPLDERFAEMEKEEAALNAQKQSLKQKEAALKKKKKKMLKEQSEAERKKRTHRLVEAGASLEDALGLEITEERKDILYRLLTRVKPGRNGSTYTYAGYFHDQILKIEQEQIEKAIAGALQDMAPDSPNNTP